MTERTRRPSHLRRLTAAALGVLLAVGALAQPTAAVAQETTIDRGQGDAEGHETRAGASPPACRRGRPRGR